MTVEGTVRLTHEEIKQIIADYVGSKFNIVIPADKVSLWPQPDQYHAFGKVSASANVSDYTEVNGVPS